MKKTFKILILSVLWLIYKIIHPLFHREEIVVLMYHSVGRSNWKFSISPEMFERQIIYILRNNYKFLNAGNLLDILENRISRNMRAVSITFDDGYRDFMTEAVPILNKYKIPAILFVHTNRSPERLGNNLSLLSWPEIKSLSNNFEIGSHAHSHPDLKILSEKELNEELDNVEQVFLHELGYKPQFFSYPGGRFNANIMENLRKRGYKLAFTINPGLIREGNNLLVLPRFGLSIDTSFTEFKARVSGAGSWYEKLADLFRHKNKKKSF